ncbi:hypothetical protein GCM10029964_032740 [Kibdelosporangium lantanae]
MPADMVNWTDHGSPMSLATFSWASKDALAGQAIERDGRFYWYVPMVNRATGRMAVGVGVADSPTGPFHDALGRPLVENGEIDPTVFLRRPHPDPARGWRPNRPPKVA